MDPNYELYRLAIQHGTPLSHAEFLRFWTALTPEAHDYWLGRFRNGNVGLTEERSQELEEFLDAVGSGLYTPEVK